MNIKKLFLIQVIFLLGSLSAMAAPSPPTPQGAPPPGFFLPYIGIVALAGLVFGALRIIKNNSKNKNL